MVLYPADLCLFKFVQMTTCQLRHEFNGSPIFSFISLGAIFRRLAIQRLTANFSPQWAWEGWLAGNSAGTPVLWSVPAWQGPTRWPRTKVKQWKLRTSNLMAKSAFFLTKLVILLLLGCHFYLIKSMPKWYAKDGFYQQMFLFDRRLSRWVDCEVLWNSRSYYFEVLQKYFQRAAMTLVKRLFYSLVCTILKCNWFTSYLQCLFFCLRSCHARTSR